MDDPKEEEQEEISDIQKLAEEVLAGKIFLHPEKKERLKEKKIPRQNMKDNIVDTVTITDNGKGKRKEESENQEEEQHDENNIAKKSDKKKNSKGHYTLAYKYSNKFKGSLHESVILGGLPVFISYENGKIKAVKKIEEATRDITPPYSEECPYEPYEFSNMEEIEKKYVKQANAVPSIGHLFLQANAVPSIGHLFLQAKQIVKKYNDQDDYKLTLIAADIIFSYFQDKFSTTHYIGMVGDNDSGKSSLGITFESIAYRPVYMTDPSAANVFRCLGTVEPGQCTIIMDEADKIDKSLDMMSILKTGYQSNKKVAKVNTNSWRQEFYYTFGLKLIIGERSLSLADAKGVRDRTFTFTTYAGDSEFDIKETLMPQGNPARQERLNELLDFRKLMLVYRLIHFADPLPDIDTGVKRRDRELSKPLLQLFSCNGTQVEVQKQIALMLEMFLDVKRQNKKSSAIEVAYYPIIIDMFSKNRRHVPVGDIWSRIVEGGIPGYYDAERKPKEYQTDEYGTIYRNSFTNIICDKFGAIKKHTDKGSVLIFDIDKLQKLGKSYDLEAKIQLKLVEDGGGPDNPDSSDNIIRSPTIIKENADKEIINNRLNNVETFEANLTSDVNNTTLQNDKVSSTLIKSSELSELSATEGIASLKMYDDGNDKATAVAEAAATTATTIATATIDGPAIAAATTTTNTTIANTAATATTTIYRLGHSDIWACKNCKQKGDKWFMKIHECSGSRNENR